MGAIGQIGQGNSAGQPGQTQQLRGKTQQIVAESVQQRQATQAPGVPSAVAPVDEAQMSNELLDEVDHKGGEGNGNVDEMLRGLANSFLDHKTQQAGVGAGQDDGSIKDSKPTVERTQTWKPSTREGELLGAKEKIGDVETKETVTPAKNAGQTKKKGQQKAAQARQQAAASAGGASPSGSVAGAATGAAAAKVGGAQSAASVNKDDNDQEDDKKGTDKVELSPESQALAANLAKQGVQSSSALSNQPASDEGTIKQASKLGGGKTEKTVAQEEATTKAGGWNQTAWVRPEGTVKEGDSIRSYDKLDDMPDDLMTGFHRKDAKDANADYQNKVERGEKVTPLNGNQAQMLQQMRMPIGNVK